MFMLKFSLNDHFKWLLAMSQADRDKELFNTGWKELVKNSEYSRDYYDIDEELEEYNIDKNSIERIRLKFSVRIISKLLINSTIFL